jgi:hypothetical protein
MEMTYDEKCEILKSYEEVINEYGEDISDSTLKRYSVLVNRYYKDDPLKAYNYVKKHIKGTSLQILLKR